MEESSRQGPLGTYRTGRGSEYTKQHIVVSDGLTAPAVNGRANKAVIEVLAEFFKVKKRCIKIIGCEKTREKIIQIQ